MATIAHQPQNIFVIRHNGQEAWEWDRPSNRVIFANLSISVDDWKNRMESKGFKIIDDRGQPAGNVWD